MKKKFRQNVKFHLKTLAAGSRAVTWYRSREFIKSFINHLRDSERHNIDFVLFCFVITLSVYKEATFSFPCTAGWLP